MWALDKEARLVLVFIGPLVEAFVVIPIRFEYTMNWL